MPNTSVNADLNVNVNANVDDARVKIEGLEKLIAGDAWKVRLVADDSGILKQLQKISAQKHGRSAYKRYYYNRIFTSL